MTLATAILVAAAAALTPSPGTCEADVAQLEQRVEALEDRLAALERSPPPTGDDIALVVPVDTARDSAISLAGPVDVFGTIHGDVVAMGGDVRVHSGGRVTGDAVSIGGQVVVSPGGTVNGEEVTLGRHGAHLGPMQREAPSPTARWAALWMGLGAALVLMAGIWPGRVDRIADALRSRPLRNAAWGAVALGGASVVGTVLLITIIGAPFALALAFVLATAGMLGFASLCRTFGEQLPGLRNHQGWAPVLVGVGVLALVGAVPYGGPVLLTLLAFPALGAALTTRGGASEAPED